MPQAEEVERAAAPALVTGKFYQCVNARNRNQTSYADHQRNHKRI
jgi:hypothetical protein